MLAARLRRHDAGLVAVLTLLTSQKSLTCHAVAVRTPSGRQRRHEIARPADVDLVALASRVSYVGSAEHKTYPSSAGAPSPRADATKCDPSVHGDLPALTGWLRRGMAAGAVGSPWQGDFPRYVWVEQDGTWYEGRLVNREQGSIRAIQ